MKQNSWRHLLFLQPGGHRAVNRVIDGGMMEELSPPPVASSLTQQGARYSSPCGPARTTSLGGLGSAERLACRIPGAPAQAAHALRTTMSEAVESGDPSASLDIALDQTRARPLRRHLLPPLEEAEQPIT
jgi:hypothetical protein